MVNHTLHARQTLRIARRGPANAVRRWLKRPLSTYETHLSASATVASRTPPALSIEADAQGRPVVVFTWPGITGGHGLMTTLAERGGRKFPAIERHDFPALDKVRAAVQATEATMDKAMRAALHRGGVVNPDLFTPLPMAFAFAARESIIKPVAERIMDEHRARARRRMEGERGAPELFVPTQNLGAPVFVGVDLASGPDLSVEVQLPRRVAAMFAEGHTGPMPSDAPAPPTESTTVLHDLRFIADCLETAQFQISMTPGGSAEGSVDNEAHRALLAVQLVQAKMAVAGERGAAIVHLAANVAANLKAVDASDMRSSPALNKARSQVDRITQHAKPLATPPEESAHVRF